MRNKFLLRLTPRRKLAVAFSVSWILLALLVFASLPLAENLLAWSPGYVTALGALSAFSGAVVLAEILRAYAPAFAEINDDQHFLTVLCIWGALFSTAGAGFLLVLQGG